MFYDEKYTKIIRDLNNNYTTIKNKTLNNYPIWQITGYTNQLNSTKDEIFTLINQNRNFILSQNKNYVDYEKVLNDITKIQTNCQNILKYFKIINNLEIHQNNLKTLIDKINGEITTEVNKLTLLKNTNINSLKVIILIYQIIQIVLKI